MAWKGPWGCYIHIPKTSGMWTKRVLSQLGHGERDGQTHQFPKVWAHPRYFTIVREPADWLRSVFCNRRQSRWQEHPEPSPWAEFCKIIIPYRSKDFEEFVELLSTNLPGIVSWFYGCYTPPKVIPVRYGEDQVEYLRELGCHPEREMPVNVSGNKPKITKEIRSKVYHAEREAYERYHWGEDGKCYYLHSFAFEVKK